MGEKLFECKDCDKKFSHKGNLVSHIRWFFYHSLHCSYYWIYASYYVIYIRVFFNIRIHTGDKPFECKDCDRKFSHQSNLLTHIRWQQHNLATTELFCMFLFLFVDIVVVTRKIQRKNWSVNSAARNLSRNAISMTTAPGISYLISLYVFINGFKF